MPRAFSEEWAQAWGRAINDSPVYRESAASWEGSVAAVAVDTTAARWGAVLLDVWHGECRLARAATSDDLQQAAFVLEGGTDAWRNLFEGRVAPMMALLTGQIRLSRGELARLLPYANAAKELIRLASTVETEFPDGSDA